MSGPDPRAQYLANIAASVFGGDANLAAKIAEQAEMNAFVNELDIETLQILGKSNGAKCFVKELVDPSQQKNLPPGVLEVHFIKLVKDELNLQELQSQVLLSSMRGEAVNSIYQILNKVYIPLIRNSDKKGKNTALKDQLQALRATLRQTIRGTATNLAKIDFDPEMCKGISEPFHEIQVWQDVESGTGMTDHNEKLRGIASVVLEQFKDVIQIFENLVNEKLTDLVLHVRRIEKALDDVWTCEDVYFQDIQSYYPQGRMANMFKVLSRSFGVCVERVFADNEVWENSLQDVRPKLNECINFCYDWKQTMKKLCNRWSVDPAHAWKGEPYSDSYLEALIRRLLEILELRSQHDDLLRLLTSDEQKALNVDSFFEVFKSAFSESLYVSELSSRWNSQKKAYENRLQPAEKEICAKLLKELYVTKEVTATQRMREMQRWGGLMKRPSVQSQLIQERKTVVEGVLAEIQRMREDFNTRSASVSLDWIPNYERPPQYQNSSPVASAMVWARQYHTKINSNLMCAKSLFSDLEEMNILSQEGVRLRETIQSFEQKLFGLWHQDLLSKIRDKTQVYTLSGRLMEMELVEDEMAQREEGQQQNGFSYTLLKVNYSDRLVTLVKDLRVMVEHGFGKKIDPKIAKIAEQAKLFYKEGVALKQIANFYNSMNAQVLVCHKPMIALKAQNFEREIKQFQAQIEAGQAQQSQAKAPGQKKFVTWNDPAQIEAFTRRVKKFADDIMIENRRLRRIHTNIIDEVQQLKNIDMLRSRDVWTQKLGEVNTKVSREIGKFSFAQVRLWLQEINEELYRALEYQYKIGLGGLNENLREIKTDLVMRDKGKLEFNPSVDKLKELYIQEIQQFIDFPRKVTIIGLSGTSPDQEEKFKTKMLARFAKMASDNPQAMQSVYTKAEDLFKEVSQLKTKYLEWTAIARIDLKAQIANHFKSINDWTFNLNMIKQKKAELKRLDDSEKRDCITINITNFKYAVEDKFSDMASQLGDTLKESTQAEFDEVTNFVQTSLKRLVDNPQSLEAINDVKKAVLDIVANKSRIERIFQDLQNKNRMIMQSGGVGQKMGKLEAKWREFNERLDYFQGQVESQKQRLRDELDKKATALAAETEKMYDRWQQNKPKDTAQLKSMDEADEIAQSLKDIRKAWSDLEGRIEQIQTDAASFEKQLPPFEYYERMKDELGQANDTWGFFEQFKQELEEMYPEEWLTYRKKKYFAFSEFTHKMQDSLKTKQPNVVVRFLKQQLEAFRQAWPLLKLCTGEAFEKDHWAKLFQLLRIPQETKLDSLTFRQLVLSIPYMVKNQRAVKELCERAQGEVSIRDAINEISIWCQTAEFSLAMHTSNGRETPLIKEWKEVITKISDHQSLIMAVKESQYSAGFQAEIADFEQKFGGLDEYLAKLNVIQRKWVYLEPIFMRGALPAEQGRFMRVDEDYRSIALGIGADRLVVSLCDVHGLKESLETILSQLDMCQKALNSYLEEKRTKFSRFYFIGDDDLLEILGQAKNPAVIQSHLKKLFAGIFKVDLVEGNTKIRSMISAAGEQVPLNNAINISETVEDWLMQLEDEMRSTLDVFLKKAFKAGQLDIGNLPSQICCLHELINFSRNCTQAIVQRRLPNYKQDLQKTLESYTSFDNKGDVLLFSKLKALILDIIHNVDVVDQLLKDGVIMSSGNPNDWMWYKQLKYQISQQGVTMVGMCSAFFDYTYEYQGNASKLVHTPLTDKCYLTLVLGMQMGFGGNPYGPAGTGKTESVKALGQAFGRQVLVFNCDEGLDYKSMGRIFIGLVKCGAWGCFDEFNRLLEEQLSAISQQIQVIQFAIKTKQPTMELLGRTDIPVNKNAGIFVTMNPAGKGYGGRSKLPDNLKQLFRPVAMSSPDVELIAETMLFSEGFKHAPKLARKVVSLFKLMKQLLSQQQHYDWALRAIKTVLNTGGQLIQAELRKGAKLDYNQEALLLIKSIRVNTISKLTYSDSHKYEDLQQDMFPGIQTQDIDYGKLVECIKEALAELKLLYIEKQVQKMLQFYEATRQRMGVILVGPSGCGKTTIWAVLKLALQKMGRTIVDHIMNPKSMPRHQLLGLMNHDTREFQDGVLTMSARKVVKESNDTICWIVNDGDIDPEWVESLNSVLDDNHLLTLPNGERINFGDNVNFIFETHEIRYASPATVTRLGMIFLSEEDVDIGRITQTWLSRQDPKMQSNLAAWLEDIFNQSLAWVLNQQDQFIVETTKVGIVNNALSYMHEIQNKSQFTYACIQGLGGNFNLDVRTKMVQFIKNLSGEALADPKNLLQNYYDPRLGKWLPFAAESSGKMTVESLNADLPPIIKTETVQRDLAMIRPWLERGESFIVVGPEGCGKNLLIRNQIKQMKSTQIAIIHCNAATSAFHVIQKLNQMCSTSTGSHGKVYRPRDCQRLIIYLKDINLPKPDKYNTIQLIAFLQQIVCYKGFYDENLEFVYLERIQIVASMNPSSTIGRHKISTRFTANVRIYYMSYPQDQELVPVYSEFMRTILSTYGEALAKSKGTLAKFLITAYSDARQKFSVDDHRHYLFTPRDLTGVVFNLLRYSIGSPQDLIEVLIYELQRAFRDRLVDKDAKKRFDTSLSGILKRELKYQNYLRDTFFLSRAAGQGATSKVKGLPPLGRIGTEDVKATISQALLAYEREYKAMDMQLIDEVVETVAYCERALSQPGANMLLAGRAGAGGKEATQLVAHLLNMEFFSPSIGRDYGIKEFKRDLKEVLRLSGVEATRTCLFVEDYQLLQPEFLEFLNSLISAGEVPGLYTPQELEPILMALKDEMSNQYECKTAFEFFVSRVKKNLAVVLSLNYQHPDFPAWTAQNPALFSKCTIVWSDAWSKESLLAVSQARLREVAHDIGDKFEAILQSIQIVQSTARDLGASEQSFSNLLEQFARIYSSIKDSSGGQFKHLQGGLQKLSEAQDEVDKLSRRAIEQKRVLAAKEQEAKVALQEITKSIQAQEKNKAEVEKLQEQCNRDQHEIQASRAQVEQELSGVQPEVDAARAAVGQLKASNLNEVKSLRIPPEPVNDVLQAVLKLMGQEDTSWNAMKRFLGQAGVVQSIMTFDANQVTPGMRKKVHQLINQRPNSFQHESIYAVSRAVAPLASWVVANVKYSEVLLRIEPLTSQLNGLLEELEYSQAKVAECQDRLAELQQQGKVLNDDFQTKTSDAALLKSQLAQEEATLQAATALLGQLSGENERWKQQCATLASENALIPIKSLLSAASIVYLGAVNEQDRELNLKNWCDALKVNDFNIRTFLASEAQLLTFKKEGLPADNLSMENAIYILNAARTPLIIDPATQATTWLKQTLTQSKESIEVLNHQDKKFNTQLELAIRFGKVLVIQEVDGIEAMLFPLLNKDFNQQGPRQIVMIGEKAVDYNPAFQLYLTTRDQFVQIPPNAQPLVTNVNFTVTKSGLESQLLSITINFEKPELESKKTEILEQQDKLQIELAGYEKSLLEELASSEGNILDNKALIDSLEQTKKQSSQIEEALANQRSLAAALDQERNVYRNFAYTGSTLFMVIGELIKINNMYQFSLASFVKLFERALETKPAANSTEEKLSYLQSGLTKLCFSEIGRSLFKADRLTYSLQFVHGIFPNLFRKDEWEFFTAQYVGSGQTNVPHWIARDRHDAFKNFGATFPHLLGQFALDQQDLWADFVRDPTAEQQFPQQIMGRVSPFQRLMVVKVLRPDRLETAMQLFVDEAFGGQRVQAAPFALRNIYEQETTPSEPILFIISPGSDPSSELQEFAETVVGRQAFHEIAMGGGQNEAAVDLVKQAAVKGEWVALKNLHLVTSWLPNLEKEIKTLNCDKKFRLWLTTEPHTKFPSILLQSSLKISYETPPGLKNNLMRTFQYVAPSPQVQQQKPAMTQLLFILSWFHAMIQERRKYIPQGWSKYYEFSFGDVKAGELTLDGVFDEGQGGKLQWQKIYGILENAIYGGRVDNVYDLRVLRAYIENLFNEGTMRGQVPLSGIVAVPGTGNIRDYQPVLNQIPDEDQPSIFGLPANIDRSVQRFNSNAVINQLKQLAAVSESEMRFNKQKWALVLGPICKLWVNLYKEQAQRTFDQIQITQQQLNVKDPVEAFVYMEIQTVQRILQTVDESLTTITKILKGEEMLTEKSAREARDLMRAQVPASWESAWEGPASPNDWVVTLNRKALSLLKWLQLVQARQLLEGPLNLSDLFHPETFLNALRQRSARELNTAIDELKLVTSFETGKIATAVKVEGLWLQGSDFDGKCTTDIAEGEQTSEVVQLPTCYMGWLGQQEPEPYPEGSTVVTPIYLGLDREKLLCTINLPNSGDASRRIISGVALFLTGSE